MKNKSKHTKKSKHTNRRQNGGGTPPLRKKKVTTTEPRNLYLHPAMIGPWITGTNKTSTTAFANHVCRVAGALMGGWEEPNLYENESIRRAHALRDEALAAIDTFADVVLMPGNVFSVLDPISIFGVTMQARPNGYSVDDQIGCTIRTPWAANHLANCDASLTTEELWDAVAHFAMIPEASHWLAVSYSPPFAPIIKWIDRKDYTPLIGEVRYAFQTFTEAVDSILHREMNRLTARKVSYFNIKPIPSPIQ